MELSFTLRNVILGASLLGAVGGVVGSFALLRRQSMLGDALAHAALPGVALAFLLTNSKHPLVLLTGALVAGVLGALLMLGIVRYSRIKEDSAMGIVLSVFFGIGIVLLTVIQRLPTGNKAGLDKFLFGQAATLVTADVVIMATLSALVLLAVALQYKELKLLAFDPEFGRSLGLPMRGTELLLTVSLVLVVVVGLQMVGVVLMVATLITPAAAARQWTQRLGVMLVLAAAIGAVAGAGGAVVSAVVPRMPTGPTIVLASSAVLIVSLVFAPERGILWRFLRSRGVAARIRREHLLKDLYLAGERAGAPGASVTWETVAGVRGQAAERVRRTARSMARARLLTLSAAGLELTPAGLDDAAQLVRKHRLWEVYLSRRLDLADDHVHRPAEDMEHALSEEAVTSLEESLGHPTVDPHGQPIPPRRAA